MEEPVILVVEDEARVRDLIREILETAGYEVLTAADGEQALQVSRTFPTTFSGNVPQ
jgi:CheY-like chemotaxis protein